MRFSSTSSCKAAAFFNQPRLQYVCARLFILVKVSGCLAPNIFVCISTAILSNDSQAEAFPSAERLQGRKFNRTEDSIPRAKLWSYMREFIPIERSSWRWRYNQFRLSIVLAEPIVSCVLASASRNSANQPDIFATFSVPSLKRVCNGPSTCA